MTGQKKMEDESDAMAAGRQSKGHGMASPWSLDLSGTFGFSRKPTSRSRPFFTRSKLVEFKTHVGVVGVLDP